MKIPLLIILNTILFFTTFTNAKICPDIHFSSNISKVKDDMVKNGITTPKWTESSSTPIIIGSSKLIDYIYVTIERHLDDQLNVINFLAKFF